MPEGRRFSRLFYLLILFVFVFLLVAGVVGRQMARERLLAPSRAVIPVLTPNMIIILLILFVVAGIVAAVLFVTILKRYRLSQEEVNKLRRARWYLMLAAFMPLLLLVFLFYHWRPEEGEEKRSGLSRLGEGMRGIMEMEVIQEAERAPELGYMIFVPILLFLLSSIGLSIFFLFKVRDIPSDDPPPEREEVLPGLDGEAEEELRRDMAEAIRITERDILAERDFRSAVILCYARLEEILVEHGVVRPSHLTSREYVNSVLTRLAVPARNLKELNELYERARFSQHTIEREDRDEAVYHFRRVRESLTALAEQESGEGGEEL